MTQDLGQPPLNASQSQGYSSQSISELVASTFGQDLGPGDHYTQAVTPEDWKPDTRCCWCNAPLVQAVDILGAQPWICPTPACHTRQLKFALVTKVGKVQRLIYLPLPRQTEAHEAVMSGQYRRILYGGAAGGGKSKFLRWLAYSLCLRFKNFRVLLLRRSYPELEETHIRESVFDQELFGPKGGGVMVCTPSNFLVEFPETGSYIKFGHCQDDKAMSTFLSREYDLILFDELVTFEEQHYLLISSRARTSRTDWAPLVVAGTNPGGPGAAWVTQLFINKDRDKKKYPHYNPQAHHFIRALLDDNPYINASYVEFLMDLDPEMREAYRWGNWHIFPGQYFKEFRQERFGKPWHVGYVHGIPQDLPRICGMDWGYLRPGVILWAVVLPDGRLYIEREWVFQETAPSLVGQGAALMATLWGITTARCVGDPAMAIRNAETGESIFETLRTNGWYCLPAKHERVNGWIRVREWLKPWKDGRPGILISPDCPYLIRTLPQMRQDAHKPEDLDTDSEDHACDALRYLVMDRPSPLTLGTVKSYTPGSAGQMLQDLITANSTAPLLGSNNLSA